MEQLTNEDILQALNKEYVARSKKNPRYSLRAFSRFLEVDQSQLSKILSRKIEMSTKMRAHLSQILYPATTPEVAMATKKKNELASIAVPAEMLPVIREEVQKFRDHIASLCNVNVSGDIYHLTIDLHPVVD